MIYTPDEKDSLGDNWYAIIFFFPNWALIPSFDWSCHNHCSCRGSHCIAIATAYCLINVYIHHLNPSFLWKTSALSNPSINPSCHHIYANTFLIQYFPTLPSLLHVDVSIDYNSKSSRYFLFNYIPRCYFTFALWYVTSQVYYSPLAKSFGGRIGQIFFFEIVDCDIHLAVWKMA